MNEPFKESTQAKARELARQITVAHDLDPEIQEELYGHIEDKLMAYKSGEEPLSDEDAFILVREHFGDTRVLRNLLEDVHVEAVQVGWGRKILALVIVAGCIGVVSKAVQSTFNLGVFLAGIPLYFMTHKLLAMLFGVAMLVTLFGVLIRWKRASAAGARPWYAGWPLSRLATWAALLLLMTLAIPNVQVQSEGNSLPLFGALYFVASLGLLVAFCAIWLWWIDTPPQRARNTFNAGVLWLGFLMLASQYPAVSVYIGAGSPVAYGVRRLAEGHIGDTAVTGYLTWGGPWRSFFDFGIISGFYGFVMVVGCLTYLGWQLVLRRGNPRTAPAGTVS